MILLNPSSCPVVRTLGRVSHFSCRFSCLFEPRDASAEPQHDNSLLSPCFARSVREKRCMAEQEKIAVFSAVFYFFVINHKEIGFAETISFPYICFEGKRLSSVENNSSL